MSGEQHPFLEGAPTPGPQCWIFQANPNRYRILESLQNESEECWNLNQHADDVRVGDQVLIWISGSDAGVYAVGTVVAPPAITPDSVTGQAYWLEAEQGKRAKPRVRVRYDRVLIDRPLLKPYLEADPNLWSLRILQFPRGTNFAVEREEWQAIQEWLDDAS
jgi:hypothetical protein